MKTFCIGDIHGAYLALKQCLERSSFDYSNDRLIVLGDVCDGYPEVNLAIEELLKIQHCDYILGNHDLWALDWALEDKVPEVWTSQGGNGTISSYRDHPMPPEHIHFLYKAHSYLIVEQKVFVHGGFNLKFPIDQQGTDSFVWDRKLIQGAWEQAKNNNDFKLSSYDEIFLGHTPTTNHFKSTVPVRMGNVWAMDTGAGWGGALTIMDIHSKQYWQSDPTANLYEGIQGR